MIALKMQTTSAGVPLKRTIKGRNQWHGIIDGMGVYFVPDWTRPRSMLWAAEWVRYPGDSGIVIGYGKKLSDCVRHAVSRIRDVRPMAGSREDAQPGGQP